MNNYKTLQQTTNEVIAASELKNDRMTTLHQFFAGMESPETIRDGNEELILTPGGFRQVGGMLHLNGQQINLFNHPNVLNRTKIEMLQQIASGLDDREIQVRVNGNRIDGVVSEEYSFFDNKAVAMSLLQMQMKGDIPEDVEVMRSYLSPDARAMNLRLVAPDSWNFNIQENGKAAPFRGTLIVGNNELGAGSFRAKVAITRNSCTNTTIGSDLFAINHRFAEYEDFYQELARAVGLVKEWSGQMRDSLEAMRAIPIEAPMLIFEKIGEEMGVPKYALSGDNGAVRYWEEEGEKNTLYDIVQAISAGTRELTAIRGRRTPKWERRDALEGEVWKIAEALQSMHDRGDSVEDWYLTGDVGIRERAAQYVEGFAGKVERVDMLADGIRGLELG